MTIYLKIIGRVQGVFFRAEACEKAHAFGLTGWVSNMSDGAVEAVAQGSEEALHKFIDWCHRGPAGAHVENVVVELQTPREEFKEFSIR